MGVGVGVVWREWEGEGEWEWEGKVLKERQASVVVGVGVAAAGKRGGSSRVGSSRAGARERTQRGAEAARARQQTAATLDGEDSPRAITMHAAVMKARSPLDHAMALSTWRRASARGACGPAEASRCSREGK